MESFNIWCFISFRFSFILAYVTTKYIGGKSKKASRGNYIQVIETVSLGIDKQLILVKVGEQYVLLSSSGKNIQFMTNINLGEYETQETWTIVTEYLTLKVYLINTFMALRIK